MGTAGPVAISKDLTLVALGLTLLPLAATDPGGGDLSLNPPQLDIVKTGTLASQSSRSDEAAEVGVFPGIRCHTQNTPLLPLRKTCGFFPWILHISSPPSLASQQISLPLVYPPVSAQSTFARTFCFHSSAQHCKSPCCGPSPHLLCLHLPHKVSSKIQVLPDSRWGYILINPLEVGNVEHR